jgi:formylglycine-generating enzyme required for sulfatase activity
MRAPTLPPPEPAPWRPGLEGAFPGDRCFVELGPERVRMAFCWCPPGELGQYEDGELPQVRFARGFWLAQHPVNQAQWLAVMKQNPSQRGQGPDHPVDGVSWNDAQAFCRQAGLRLPTEAEWEYACRAGTTTPFAVGDGRSLNAQRANFDGNYPDGEGREAFKWLYRERTLPEGGFPPNAWGLHDLHGQVWEWCEDQLEGRDRVLRGGCWINHGWHARSGNRYGFDPDNRADYIGFRPCPSSTPAESGPEARKPRSGARREARDEWNDGPAQR